MKKRTVKRTWRKADGTVVTREYTYNVGKSRRGKVLVNARGVINKKNVDAFKQEIRDSSISTAEKRTLLADLDANIRQRKGEKKKLTTTGFAGLQQEERIDRLFANAGYSVAEAAEEFGFSEEELLNPDNWRGDTFTQNGVQYAFAFTYTGALFSRV